MAQEPESNSLIPVIVTLLLPGVGHLFVGEAFVGLFIIIAAVVTAWLVTPLAAMGWGVLAAAHLFWATGREPEEEPKPIRVEPQKLSEQKVELKDPEPEPKPEPGPKPVSEPAVPGAKVLKPARKPDATESSEALREGSSPKVKLNLPEPSEVSSAEEVFAEEAPVEPVEGAPAEEVSAEVEEPTFEEPAFEEPGLEPGLAAPSEPSSRDFGPDDFPTDFEEDDERLERLQRALTAAEIWQETHDSQWERADDTVVEDDVPDDLRTAAEAVGRVEFETKWKYGWEFAPGTLVSLFDNVEVTYSGYRFGTTSGGRGQILWLPDGSVVQKIDGNEIELATDLPAFLEGLCAGFQVGDWARATEATMSPEYLTVLPADERPENDSVANFPALWFGARGPGMEGVGFSLDAPEIRHSRGSRSAGPVDIAAIIAFHEWLDTEPESPQEALELARSGATDSRPVGLVIRDGDVAVAWFGESPPEEADAFLDHLHGLDYFDS